MPDDRYNGPRTDGPWRAADEPSIKDAASADSDPPVASDSWASDLWAPSSDSTSEPSSDIWSPPTDMSDADAPAGPSWASDSWASTTESSNDTWTPAADTPAVEAPAGAPWVSGVWASTTPSPWVNDLWASTDPSTSSPVDAWPSADGSSVYNDRQPLAANEQQVDEPSFTDPARSVNGPFWRSESWLLEPLSDVTPSVDLTSDDQSSGPSWSDDSGSPSQPSPSGWDIASDGTDEWTGDPTDEATGEPVSWRDVDEGSDTTWSSYQDALDAPGDAPPPSARNPATLAPPSNASDFAAQRSATIPEPATKGFPGFIHKISAGHVRMRPTKDEQVYREATADIRRSIAGLRQITFTNPKGGSGKTTAALLTSMTLGQLRGGYVLAWDNNETQGTLGVRAGRDDHANTVRDLIADLPSFSGPVAGRVGDLAKYVRSQSAAMFDVLASDEQAEAGEMMTAAAFQAVREVVGRFYKIICVDTGNNVRAANWAASIDSTDQLVVTASVRWESAYSASRMLDYLEQTGRGDLVSNAVTVLTMPASLKGLNLSQVETHFGVRTRQVLRVPFDAQLDNGDEIPFGHLNPATRRAWLQIGAAITRGL